jgi:hypothetical protein
MYLNARFTRLYSQGHSYSAVSSKRHASNASQLLSPTPTYWLASIVMAEIEAAAYPANMLFPVLKRHANSTEVVLPSTSPCVLSWVRYHIDNAASIAGIAVAFMSVGDFEYATRLHRLFCDN